MIKQIKYDQHLITSPKDLTGKVVRIKPKSYFKEVRPYCGFNDAMETLCGKRVIVKRLGDEIRGLSINRIVVLKSLEKNAEANKILARWTWTCEMIEPIGRGVIKI